MGWRGRRAVKVAMLGGLLSLGLCATMVARAAPSQPAGAREVLEGTVQVLIEDHATGGRTRHLLKTQQGPVELTVRGKSPNWRSGDRVRVRGVRRADTMALDATDSTSIVTLSTATDTATTGEVRVAVLLVNFADNATQPYTRAQAQDVVFTQTDAYLRENSFQRTWLSGTTAGWFTLPIASTCRTTDIATEARRAAASAGIDLSGYNRVVYVFPRNNSCMWSGVGTVGGDSGEVWINGRLELKVVAHELGHNFGLQHAHASDCDATPLGLNCVSYDYGDVADVMGNTTSPHFNAFHKERLGWLGGGAAQQITTVSAAGSYAIGAYATGKSEVKALKIPRGIDPVTGAMAWYYVEYREAVGQDAVLGAVYGSNLVNSLLIRTATEGDRNSSFLLDMTPQTIPTFDMGDAALVYGQTFTDSAAGVSIHLESLVPGQAVVRVALSGAACMRANPSVAVSAPSGAVTAGSSVGYSLTVTSRDSASCAAATFDLQTAVPAGWSASLASAAVSLAPSASTTVPLSITSAATAAEGAYAFTVAATNRAAPGYSGNVNGSYQVAAPALLSSTVNTDRANYVRGDTVRMSTTVLSAGKPVAKARVSFTLRRPDGSVTVQSATTSAAGVATSSYRVGRRDPIGIWEVNSAASAAGATSTSSAGFAVQSQ